MQTLLIVTAVGLGLLFSLALATSEDAPKPGPVKPPGDGTIFEACPRPPAQSIRCLQEWACQQVIRLDLRCLLNLNGNNLLGNLVSIPGIGGGGNGGILGGLLGG
ncbi:GH15770 [Drosophila grimshawi]|uniref:GH15770 n=1 Tax=Drosophila grimshawi TaxID=7222 RepID=B4IZ37_DROGR|nr:GH15770 [Drosophila grimshawi]